MKEVEALIKKRNLTIGRRNKVKEDEGVNYFYQLVYHIGGIKKGRPNEKDLEKAREFAKNLK